MAIGDLPPEAHVIPSLKQAWNNIWPQFWWLLLFGFLSGLANGFGSNASVGDYTAYDGVLDGIGALLSIFVGIPLGYGVVKAHLQASRGEKPTWDDLGWGFGGDRYLKGIGLGLLVVLMVIGGLILLIIPGIYIGVRLTFAGYHFIEDGLDPMDAIKASWETTQGRWWSVFGLVLIAIPIVIAGLLALVIGVFVSFVLISQMAAVYFRATQQDGATPDVPPPALQE